MTGLILLLTFFGSGFFMQRGYDICKENGFVGKECNIYQSVLPKPKTQEEGCMIYKDINPKEYEAVIVKDCEID